MLFPPAQRVKVTINNTPYLVEVVDPSASPLTVKVNGQTYKVRIEAEEMTVTPAPLVTEPTSERLLTAVSTGMPTNCVKSPMPGNILDIQVKPGDRVSYRQHLCSLEAMKMKNVIRSPRDGVIATVTVANGQAVTHSQILFTFVD